MQMKRAIFGLVFMLVGALITLQIKTVVGAPGSDPISSPITSPIGGTPTPTETPSVTPTPTDTPVPTATPTPVPSTNGNGNSDNHSNDNHNDGGSHSSASSPVCGDAKPTTVPQLLAAIPSGPKKITIYWNKVNGPVNHFVVSYGTKSGVAQYGTPSVGNADTTNFTVDGLAIGTKYFFKVEPVNGCMPGEFSNEVSAVASNKKGYAPSGLNFAVLGTSATNNNVMAPVKKTVKKEEKKEENRIVVSTQKTSFTLIGFITGLFSHK